MSWRWRSTLLLLFAGGAGIVGATIDDGSLADVASWIVWAIFLTGAVIVGAIEDGRR